MHYFDERGMRRVYHSRIDRGIWKVWRDHPGLPAQIRHQLLLKCGRVVWDWNARIGTDYRKMASDYGIRDVDKIIFSPKK